MYLQLLGAQPEIFQSRRRFVELGHFAKHFIKKNKKSAWKDLGIFFLDTLTTTFLMENLTHRWTVRAFIPKSGHFFLIFN